MRSVGEPRSRLAGGQSERSGRWHSLVWMTGIPAARKPPISRPTVGTMAASRFTSLPRLSPKPPGSMKSRCMSMTMSAVVAGSKRKGNGCRVDHRHQWCPAMCRPMTAMSAALAGRLVDDPPFRHDEDAVRELEDLVEVLADQEHGRAGIACRDDARADLGDGGEIEPEAGIGRRPADRPRRSARARARRAARCRRKASRWASPSRPS